MEREEAIQVVRGLTETTYFDDRELEGLRTLIPELTESEDEWIRKLLVWQVHRNIEDETNDLAQSVYDGIKGHDPDIEESIEDWKKCLAWLEKQKDIDKMIVVSPEVWDNAINEAFENGKKESEKQKEQKPVEWSEEDELMILTVIQTLETLGGRGTTGMQIDWLKSLRPLPHWKPSEKDEKYPEDKSFEEEWKEYYNNSLSARLPMNKREVARHFYWFAKKQSWKPSEEQMSMLLAVIRDPNNAGSESCFLALQSLYEDLRNYNP